MAASVDLYIYYQVREADAPALAARVRAMQASLGLAEGRAQLKRRPGAADGCQTWMEVYGAVAPGFAAVIEAAALPLAPLTAGKRHVEVFTELPDEAPGGNNAALAATQPKDASPCA